MIQATVRMAARVQALPSHPTTSTTRRRRSTTDRASRRWTGRRRRRGATRRGARSWSSGRRGSTRPSKWWTVSSFIWLNQHHWRHQIVCLWAPQSKSPIHVKIWLSFVSSVIAILIWLIRILQLHRQGNISRHQSEANKQQFMLFISM